MVLGRAWQREVEENTQIRVTALVLKMTLLDVQMNALGSNIATSSRREWHMNYSARYINSVVSTNAL